MISIKNISKVFNKGQQNELTAVRNVSLDVEEGSFLVMVGSNGSGKSTLLNLLAGSESVSSGQIKFHEADVTKIPEHKRSKWVARVFQNPYNGTAPELSILDNFRLAALRSQPKKIQIGITDAFKKQVQEKISMLGMGLENKITQPIGSLSGGQRQALTLLMSVMDKTDILLLDEPTAALDPKSANVVIQLASKLIREYKMTAIWITHNLKDAQQYGDRLIQMQEGRIQRDLDGNAKKNLTLPEMVEWFG
jgi:putative ABC transport system ATP-binding protein